MDPRAPLHTRSASNSPRTTGETVPRITQTTLLTNALRAASSPNILA
jgi:hypothetical protein